MEEPNPYRSPSSGGPAASPATPPQPGSSLDLGRCFAFFFRDPDWVRKLLIGSLFTVLAVFLVGSFFLAGYMIRLIRGAAGGETHPLPEWDDLSGIFMDGLYAIAAYLMYLLPVIVLSIVLAVVVGAANFGEGEPSPLVALVAVVWWMIVALIMLAILVFVPAAMVRLALKGTIRSAFDFEKIFDFIKRNIGNYLLAILAFILANFASQFGLLLLCIGIIPASFWATAVGAYAFGEVAWRDRAGTGETVR